MTMVEPPKGHDESQPHRVSKHYYMMMAEMTGHVFLHDEYCVMANWIITKINSDNDLKT